ncbi:MAG: methyltransferase domain-containing protein [Nitrospinota bacterium]
MSRQEQWQLGGDAPEAYERCLVPAVLGPLAADLVELASLQPGERVLDVACGTGAVARLAAQRVGARGRLMGLDLNSGMLAVARSLPASPGAPVQWLRGDALALPSKDEAFDVVLCQQGLQYFPDRPAALREMYRTLAPGGRLALSVARSLQFNPVHALLVEALERHVSSETAEILRAGFAFGDAEELRTLIAGAGFRQVVIRPAAVRVSFPSPAEFVWRQVAGSPLAGPVAQANEEARVALIRDAEGALQPYVSDDRLTFPLGTNHAVAFR